MQKTAQLRKKVHSQTNLCGSLASAKAIQYGTPMQGSLLKMAEAGGLLFDGAMGTLLYQRGIFLNRCFEAINLEQPELVQAIHQEYIEAGATVQTTNTFGANRIRLSAHGFEDQVDAINQAAVRIAREALNGSGFVAGSVGPTGVGLSGLAGDLGQAVRTAFTEQISVLCEAGVDCIILETFDVLQELELATEIARECTSLPLFSLMMFSKDGRSIGGGLTPQQVAPRLIAAGADIIGANCGGGPDLLFKVTTAMVGHGKPVMAQPNAGQPETIEGRSIYIANPEYFGVYARRLMKAGIRVVGGCCGTTPEHIERMSNATRMISANDAIDSPAITGGEDLGVEPVPVAERSSFAAKLSNGEFVSSVELNPPRGFDLSKRIAAVKSLVAAGVTTINIADGPRAKVLMSNLAMAHKIEQATSVSPIVHVCCRDRNLLGLQSHLLGMHMLDVRNIVIITGDPPKMGPFPNATGVYDVNSIGLLKMVQSFNRGLDPAGQQLPEATSFFPGTGVEPNAADLEVEIHRLEQKVQAGAEFVMTQPVYDAEVLRRFLKRIKHIHIPVLLGLCPLAGIKNAQFLNKHVPGMSVPAPIIKRLEKAESKGLGQTEGVQIAREMLDQVRPNVQGVYVMPPFSRHQMAIDVLKGFIP